MREALITLLSSRDKITIETGGFEIYKLNDDEFYVKQKNSPDDNFYTNAEQAVESFLMCFDL